MPRRARRSCHSPARTIEALEARHLLNAAELDASFSDDGQYLSSDVLSDAALAVKRQDDGKLVVAGTAVGGAASGDYGFYVQRFHADGTLDGGFGTGGRVTTQFTPGGDFAYDVLVQPADGKIVAVGVADGVPQWGNSAFALVRYNPDGTRDVDFGTDGLVTTDLGPRQDGILGAALQPDGKIVVAGFSATELGVERFTVARYLTDGTLDGSFGNGGVVVVPFNAFASRAAAVAIDADGKIVVAGTSRASNLTTSANFAVVRLNEDGTPDTTFDGDGKAVVDHTGPDEATALALQSDGKILVAGKGNYQARDQMAVARLNADGSADKTWAGDGTRVVFEADNSGAAVAVLVHSDGRVLLAGQVSRNPGVPADFALVRLTETAELDPTFGDGGVRRLDFGGESIDQAADAVFLPGERVVIVGTSNGGAASRPFDTAIAQFEGGADFASLQGGTLSVVGTAGDDAIEIAASDQDIVVTRNGVAKTIPGAVGHAGQPITLDVRTLGGNDVVNVALVRPGTIILGSGDDSVTVAAGGVGTQSLLIQGGLGSDRVSAPLGGAGVPVHFSGGEGAFLDALSLTGTAGDDVIHVGETSVTGAGGTFGYAALERVDVDAAAGNDTIEWTRKGLGVVDGGEGNDAFRVGDTSFSYPVTVLGGAGDDRLTVTADEGPDVDFDGGDGRDEVVLLGRAAAWDVVTIDDRAITGGALVLKTAVESLFIRTLGGDDEIIASLTDETMEIDVDAGAGDDKIKLTYAAARGVKLAGGDGADTLYVGTGATDDDFVLRADGVAVNGTLVEYGGVERVTINGGDGNDTIVYPASEPLPAVVAEGNWGRNLFRFIGTDAADAIAINGPFIEFGGREITASMDIEVDAAGGADTLEVRGPLPVRFTSPQDLAALKVDAGARVELHGDGTAVRMDSLTIADGGRLDLGTGSLHVTGGDVKAIEALMKTARNASVRWAGPGIGTRWAGAVTGLCAAEVAAPAPGVLVKYTYDGDANLDGRINADDYFRIDSAFLAGEPEPLCSMGDFNFDDTVNADDYFLIDSAFLGQGAGLGERSGAARVVAMEERADRKVGQRIRGRAVWERREGRRAARHFGEIPRDGGDD